MDEVVFFKGLATKGLSPINSSERYFEGYLTVQIKDKQGEVTIVDELMKVLPVWIDRGAPISDTHSNRIIGKGINYAKVEYKDKDGELYPAIKITGKIHKNYELDTDIWTKIKSGEYKGLSFGGATKSDREPMRMKDGSIAYSLKDLEHYEVAVCRDPAVPLALITDFNPLAKATTMGEDIGNGRMMIKCDKFGCYVDKNNKEGGQIEPALAHEETVRETKTHNPKSMDHPIELETKGESDEATDKLIRAVKDPKKRKDLIDRQTAQETSAQDAAEATSDRADKDAKKGAYVDKITPVSEAYISHLSGKPQKGDQKPYCPSCGRSHVAEDKKVHQGYKDTHEGSEPTLMGIPSCPNCGHGDKKKGEDEEKAKKRETTEDGQYADTIDPKVEWARRMVGRKQESKKGEDWSNADGDLHSGMYNQNTDEGGMGKHKEKGCKCGDPKCKDPKCKHKREVGTGYGAEQNSEGEVQWQGSGSPYPKKRKAIITNIYSRLKSLDFLLRKADEEEKREHQEKREQKRNMFVHGDFSGRPDKMTPTPEQIANKKIRDEKEAKIVADKKEGNARRARTRARNRTFDIGWRGKPKKKEGEFGGMNTGEAEWTEPRQTENDRTNRKEKSEEGFGQSMLNGAQRGLGHDASYKQDSGQSAQVTEVKEEKDKSAYENSEQDGSNKKQIPHSNVDTTKTTNI